MVSAFDVARWFIRNNLDQPRNTFDGNMKLQKLLYFSQLVHFAKYDEPLFNEPIYAFENGAVVEEIRQIYKHNNLDFVQSAYSEKINLSDEHLHTLKIVQDVFGHLTATELSHLNHKHPGWKKAFENSRVGGRYYKELGVIPQEELKREALNVLNVIEAYEMVKRTLPAHKVINGKTFYYNPDEINIYDEEVFSILESFDGPEDSYTVYFDEKAGLVIY